MIHELGAQEPIYISQERWNAIGRAVQLSWARCVDEKSDPTSIVNVLGIDVTDPAQGAAHGFIETMVQLGVRVVEDPAQA